MHWKQYYEEQARTATHRNDWERTRLLSAYVVSPYMKKKLKSVTDLFPFEWDEQKKEVTEADKEKTRKLFEKWDKQMLERGE